MADTPEDPPIPAADLNTINQVVHLPPFLLAPSISALQPSGAVAGAPGLTLTVQGARFTNAATVLWNAQSRPATYVSDTVLTLALTAADLAAAASVNVQVTNPGQTASNTVVFTIVPDVGQALTTLTTALAATDPQALAAAKPGMQAAVGEIQTWVTISQNHESDLQTQLNGAHAEQANLTSQNATLSSQVAQLSSQVTALQAQAAAGKSQSASPLEIAQSIKGMVDQIHLQAQTGLGIQSTVTSLNLELKAMVNIDRATPQSAPQATLVFPDPTNLPDPAHLSTLTLAFGSLPSLQTAAAANAASNPPSPPPPPVSGAPSPSGAAPSPSSAQPEVPMASFSHSTSGGSTSSGGGAGDGMLVRGDHPDTRREWFRRSRRFKDGKLATGVIAHASRQRHRDEHNLAVLADALRMRDGVVEAPTAPGATGANWSFIGPKGIDNGLGGKTNPVVSGRITSIQAGPNSRVYVGSANGGVWVSQDSGGTWTALDEYVTSPNTTGGVASFGVRDSDSLAVGALAVQFGAATSGASSSSASAQDTIYVGTGEPNGSDSYFGIGIKVSTDSGQTFTSEATNLTGAGVYRIIIDPVDPTIVFAATTNGLYRRPTSSMATWTRVKDPDGANVAVTDLVVSGSGASRVYYAATMGKVWKSTDLFTAAPDAVTWTSVLDTEPANTRKALAASEGGTQAVYCLSQSGNLFRLDSTTAGKFKQVTNAPKSVFRGGQGNYDIVLGVDPSNSSTIYMAGDIALESNSWALSLFRGQVSAAFVFSMIPANNVLPNSSANSALIIGDPTWVGTGVHPDGHAIAFTQRANGTHDASQVWIGCDGGVFLSTTSGSKGSFVSKNKGLGITQLNYLALHESSASIIFSGSQDNGTVKNVSAGAWTQSAAGDGGGVAVDPLNAQRIIRQYNSASLEGSHDGGATWGDGAPYFSGANAWDYGAGPVAGVAASLRGAAATENSQTSFYGPLRAIADGAKSAVAFGTYRVWWRPDWTSPWVTLPTGTSPYAGAAAVPGQDSLGRGSPPWCSARHR